MPCRNTVCCALKSRCTAVRNCPPGSPVLCDVVLEGTDGACCTLPCPDKELTRLGIDEGSRVHLLPDGTLQKISEELL